MADDYWYLTALPADTPIDRRLVTSQALQQAVADGLLAPEEAPAAVVDATARSGRLLLKIRRADDAGT